MENYKEIKPEDFNENTFKLIGKDWMLITAEKDSKVNTMTASWGGFGVLFNKNVAYTFIRPQRYTKEFIDNSDTFSLTFFDESFRKKLSYLGTVSGRDENKIAKVGLTVKHELNTPYFDEAKIVVICRKMYAQEFKTECIIADGIDEKVYPNKDYHTLYISEIEKIYIRE